MSNRAIIDAIKEITGAGAPAASLHIGTVKAVDEDKYTCTCRLETGGGTDMPGVKLMLNPDDGVAGIPAIGSQVLIIMQSWGEPYAIMTTELDKLDQIANKELYSHVGKSTLQLLPGQLLAEVKEGGSMLLDKDGIKLNDGSYGGIPIADNLAKEINSIKNDINDMKTIISTGASASPYTPITAAGLLNTLATGWATKILSVVA